MDDDDIQDWDRAVTVVRGERVGVQLFDDGRVYLCWYRDGGWQLAACPIWTFGDNPSFQESDE